VSAIVGVGIDIVEVARVKRLLDRWGDAFERRVFTDAEIARAAGRARPQRLAVRFAAKEAVMKALGVGWRSLAWKDIEVRNDEAGRPEVRLRGGAASAASARRVGAIRVSLSHSDHYAAAVAVCESGETSSAP
jgi:holo-[acyl-carrier protein] synthase